MREPSSVVCKRFGRRHRRVEFLSALKSGKHIFYLLPLLLCLDLHLRAVRDNTTSVGVLATRGLERRALIKGHWLLISKGFMK